MWSTAWRRLIRKIMRSPTAALTWEIWRKGRQLFWIAGGILLFGWFYNLILPGDTSTVAAVHGRLTLNCLLMVASFVFVFAAFNYTEFSRQKEWTGFPYRLFALPVTSLRLVAVPICLGVLVAELIYCGWLKLVFTHNDLEKPAWFAALLGSCMVFYQMILWTFARLRMVRMIALGVGGTTCIGVAFLPFFAREIPSRWLSEPVLIAFLIFSSAFAFAIAWRSIVRQRGDGGYRRNRLRALAEWLTDVMPRRRTAFRDASSAHFWFEWRSSGMLLPVCAGALLIGVIAPMSWVERNDPDGTLWILFWTLATPILLAIPIGKGFSKPDFWTFDLALRPFVAVRPLSNSEMVVIKLKVAAKSAAMSWAFVLMFLAVWLLLGPNLDAISTLRLILWMAYDHTMFPQYVLAALLLLAGVFLTWRFLAGGLWAGLSGSRNLFVTPVVAWGFIILFEIVGVTVVSNYDSEFRDWVRRDPNYLLSILEWIVALAVVGKFFVTARTWRNVSSRRTRVFLMAWVCGTLCLAALAMLLWSHGLLSLALMELADTLPLDVIRLRCLLILVALWIIPFARFGLAPTMLAKNRHR